MEYGLVGVHLAHSFSPAIHASFGLADYALCPLAAQDVPHFFEERRFCGINVTMPYKRVAAEWCDELDEASAATGVVNTVVNRRGMLYGYNTDCDGLLYMLHRKGITLGGRHVMILGGGATAATAAYCARKEGAKSVVTVSRNPVGGSLGYQEALRQGGTEVLLNTTPVGMYPQAGALPVDISAFPRLLAVADVVYNPLRTALCLAAQKRGVPFGGGLPMLVAQAWHSARLFLGTPPSREIEQECTALLGEKMNIVLVGLPGVGKSSQGERLARELNRPFFDTDSLVEQRSGMPIETMFARRGQENFRDMESEVVAEVAAKHNAVIATGGGAVLRSENAAALRRNGMILYLDCPAEEIAIMTGRPLAKTKRQLKRLETQRRPAYRAAADATVQRKEDFLQTHREIKAAMDRLLAE